jgi:indolepyruvate ferredoxin oxidoreductase
VRDAAGPDQVDRFDADALAVRLLGDSIYTNPLMLGYAWQKGRIPLSLASLMRAIDLNGVQIESNKAAFEWGRRAADDMQAVRALAKTGKVIELIRRTVDLDDLIAKRVEFLTAYQNAGYAAQYKAFVDHVRATEADIAISPTAARTEASRPSTKLTEAVARYLFKLMAYKDEYEVARLHCDTRFQERIAAQFEGQMGKDFQLHYHLAPPAIAKKNDKGELQKREFGPWMQTAFRVLMRFKGLRGTPLDPFGRTAERRMERALIAEYRSAIEEVLRTLGPANLALASEIARVPEMIRGYGHVKARHLETARAKWDALMAEWRAGPLRFGSDASGASPDAHDSIASTQPLDSQLMG